MPNKTNKQANKKPAQKKPKQENPQNNIFPLFFIVQTEIYAKPLYTIMLLIKCYLQVLFLSNFL